MKIKTNELIPPALDWAVCKAGGGAKDIRSWVGGYYDFGMYQYSTDWAQGGPILDRELIGIQPIGSTRVWVAGDCEYQILGQFYTGDTPLIAAMRCYCCAKLGDEIEIPQELQLCQQPNL